MTEQPIDPRILFARKRVGSLRVSELPIAALSIDPLVLTVFAGDAALAVTVINEVATMEFDLVINAKGEIDLPPKAELKSDEEIKVRYQEPKVLTVPVVPRANQKSTKRNADGRHIHTED
jgi:hypothetical protein